jgi:hypothetical protein
MAACVMASPRSKACHRLQFSYGLMAGARRAYDSTRYDQVHNHQVQSPSPWREFGRIGDGVDASAGSLHGHGLMA